MTPSFINRKKLSNYLSGPTLKSNCPLNLITGSATLGGNNCYQVLWDKWQWVFHITLDTFCPTLLSRFIIIWPHLMVLSMSSLFGIDRGMINSSLWDKEPTMASLSPVMIYLSACQKKNRPATIIHCHEVALAFIGIGHLVVKETQVDLCNAKRQG